LLYPERRKEIARHCNICTLQEETERDGTRGRKGANGVVASKAGFLKDREIGKHSKATNQDGCIHLFK
jgi:hypothetical protein